MLLSELRKKVVCGTPDDEQLALMNKWVPAGMPPYNANEMVTVPILASNNLVFNSLFCWTERALQSMVASYPGQPLMLNHEWEEVRSSVGFVYDAMLLRMPSPSMSQWDRLMQSSVNPEIDSMILQSSGLMAVLAFCAVPADSSVINVLRYRQLSDVSTGGLVRNQKLICPLCGGDFGKDDPHYPPGWFSEFLADIGEIKHEDIAPFAWHDGWHESVELSFVTAGNCAQATIFTDELVNFVCG